jgi:exosome complex component RRP45
VYKFHIGYSINLKFYVKANINALIIQVWALRVDINVLNHEGNLVAAASAAALTALSHFRCPCVTITGQETIIHDPSEKDPVPLNLHHYPVCVSYAVFNKG